MILAKLIHFFLIRKRGLGFIILQKELNSGISIKEENVLMFKIF